MPVTRRQPSEPNLEELEARLRIDETALEHERLSQHDTFYVVAKQLALAISRHDAAKNHLKEIDARTAEAIRRSWNESTDGRMTEKALADKVLLTPDVIDAREEVLQSDLQVGLWEALKEAFTQRNAALDGLIRMYLSQHYGELRLDNATRQLQAEQETVRLAQPPRRR